jgi:hypothetical protein
MPGFLFLRELYDDMLLKHGMAKEAFAGVAIGRWLEPPRRPKAQRQGQ